MPYNLTDFRQKIQQLARILRLRFISTLQLHILNMPNQFKLVNFRCTLYKNIRYLSIILCDHSKLPLSHTLFLRISSHITLPTILQFFTNPKLFLNFINNTKMTDLILMLCKLQTRTIGEKAVQSGQNGYLTITIMTSITITTTTLSWQQ